MALNVCDKCTTLFSIGAETCPHCGGKKYHEDGAPPPPAPKPKPKKTAG